MSILSLRNQKMKNYAFFNHIFFPWNASKKQWHLRKKIFDNIRIKDTFLWNCKKKNSTFFKIWCNFIVMWILAYMKIYIEFFSFSWWVTSQLVIINWLNFISNCLHNISKKLFLTSSRAKKIKIGQLNLLYDGGTWSWF